MQTTTYGKEDAKTVLIQMVDDHDLEGIESEVAEIQRQVHLCGSLNLRII